MSGEQNNFTGVNHKKKTAIIVTLRFFVAFASTMTKERGLSGCSHVFSVHHADSFLCFFLLLVLVTVTAFGFVNLREECCTAARPKERVGKLRVVQVLPIRNQFLAD